MEFTIDHFFRRGIDKVTNRFDKRRIIFANTSFVLLFFTSIGAILIANTIPLMVLGATTTSLIALFYFAHGYYPRITIVVAGIYFQFVLFIHSSILEPGEYIEYGAVMLTAGLPVLFRKKWLVYFLISNCIIFYYPYLVLKVYENFFEIGFVPGLVLFFMILSFVKETELNETRLLDKNKELISLNKEKNTLLGVVAHDLKSPLNQIRGLINLVKLTENNLTPDTKELIDRISKSSEKMSDMITEILNTELLDTKPMMLELEPIEISAIVKDVLKDFDVLAREKDITINLNMQSNEIKALGDRQGVTHVIQNLVSNAIKFSPFNTSVNIDLEVENEKVLLKVADHGPGLTSEDQEKLFKKYQKLSAKPTGGEVSTGLGLAIVKKFVNAMKGNIWCESEPNHGATFIFELKKA